MSSLSPLFLCSGLALLETLYATACVEEFFLARKEWVALATDFDIDLWESRTNRKLRAACARNRCVVVIFWVDSFLHNSPRLPDNLGLCKALLYNGQI